MVSSRLSMVAPLPWPLPLSLFSFRPFLSPPPPSPLLLSVSDNLGDKEDVVVSWLVPTNSSSWGFGSLLIGDENTKRRQHSAERGSWTLGTHYGDEARCHANCRVVLHFLSEGVYHRLSENSALQLCQARRRLCCNINLTPSELRYSIVCAVIAYSTCYKGKKYR